MLELLVQTDSKSQAKILRRIKINHSRQTEIIIRGPFSWLASREYSTLEFNRCLPFNVLQQHGGSIMRQQAVQRVKTMKNKNKTLCCHLVFLCRQAEQRQTHAATRGAAPKTKVSHNKSAAKCWFPAAPCAANQHSWKFNRADVAPYQILWWK